MAVQKTGRLRGWLTCLPPPERGGLPGEGFDPVELPARGIVAVPAASPRFMVEDLGGLDLIRITPNWPPGSVATGPGRGGGSAKDAQ